MMKYGVFIFFFLVLFTSCKPSKEVKPDSSGKINQLLVVMPNADWKGAPGDTVRKYLAAEVQVLPQREPLFTLNQLAPEVFDRKFFTLRNILILQQGDTSGVKVLRDKYAEPQLIVVVQGKDKNETLKLLSLKADSIIRLFKQHEKKFILTRRKKDFINDKLIQKELGISIKIPKEYTLITHQNGFFWYREDLPFGSKNILLYRIPGNQVDSIAENIVKIKDSIGKKYIPGPLENTYVVTEKIFSPVQRKVRFNNIEAIESRGLWEMKNDFMAGPYLNYVYYHPKRKHIVVTEGFIYLPSEDKRNMLLELEAILQSARLVD